MFSIAEFKDFIENTLNDTANDPYNKFKIFTDVGEADKATRDLNRVYTNRYGVFSVLTSNNASINGLQIYNATATVDILVNVDRAIVELTDLGEYAPVKEMRALLDDVAVKNSGISKSITVNGVTYAVTPVFTLSTAGDFAIDTSHLGKVVPMSFSVDISVVETGINSANISISINGEDVYASQIAEDMVASAEGQTRMDDSRSTFNVQEVKYALSFVMPLTTSTLSNMLLNKMHNGQVNDPVSVVVTYGNAEGAPSFSHTMLISGVRLTAQIPNNAGLNVELIEADVTTVTQEV